MDLTRELNRGGVRGGRELFKWDSLKSMSTKEREHYLGSIVHVGVPGKFGQSNKHDWWKNSDRNAESSKSLKDEKSRIKDMESQLMQEALGLKPKRLMLSRNALSTDQVEGMLKKEESTDRKADETQKARGVPPDSEAPEQEHSEALQTRGFGYREFLKESEHNTDSLVEDLDGPGEVIRIKSEGTLKPRKHESREIKTELDLGTRRQALVHVKPEQFSPRRRSRSPHRSYGSSSRR